MKSTSEEFGRIIDCRMLILDGQYFNLTEYQALKLAEKFYLFVNSLFEDSCVLLWKCKNRSIRKSSDITDSKIRTDEIFDISLLGDVKGNIVYNKSSLRAYERRLQNDIVFCLGLTPPFSATDYPDYAKTELDPYRASPMQFRDALLKLFNMEDRCNRGFYRQHDLEGCFFSSSAEENESAFSGEFFLEISCHSLGDELDKTAEKLYEFGKALVSEFSNVNMTIGVAQTEREWEQYFGAPHISSRPEMLSENEYMRKVGWANIFSPLVSQLLDFNEETVFPDSVQYEQLENGAACIRLNSTVSKTTISDLKQLKATFYPALLPSVIEFTSDWPYFRSQWENVAILDDELLTDGDKVIFRQNAKI